MASLRVNRATNTVTSGSFYKMLVLLAVGMAISTVVTGWMRQNVVDIGMRGGDAVYSIAAAFILLALPVSRTNARFLAGGAGVGAVFTALQEFGLTG